MFVKMFSCGEDCGKTVAILGYVEVNVEMVVKALSCGGECGKTVEMVA